MPLAKYWFLMWIYSWRNLSWVFRMNFECRIQQNCNNAVGYSIFIGQIYQTGEIYLLNNLKNERRLDYRDDPFRKYVSVMRKIEIKINSTWKDLQLELYDQTFQVISNIFFQRVLQIFIQQKSIKVMFQNALHIRGYWHRSKKKDKNG